MCIPVVSHTVFCIINAIFWGSMVASALTSGGNILIYYLSKCAFDFCAILTFIILLVNVCSPRINNAPKLILIAASIITLIVGISSWITYTVYSFKDYSYTPYYELPNIYKTEWFFYGFFELSMSFLPTCALLAIVLSP